MAQADDARVRGATGLSLTDLLTRYESLGDNCEFGLVQRHFGAEPLGLFRFSNPTQARILHGLQRDFADLGRRARVELDAQQPRREWILVEPDYRLRQHTYIFEGDAPETTVARQQMLRFDFLRRRILEDIATANRIFVIKSVPNLAEQQVAPIAQALRRKGPNWLLWVVADHAPGTAEIVADGLLRGQVDVLRPEGAPNFMDFSFAAWLTLLINCWTLLHP